MHTDAEPFLQRIRAFPDDDGPRLVFADWLEEQGGAALARAAFIRVQIALAGLPEVDPARADLVAAERKLFDVHGEEWAAPFRAAGATPEFRRGFVDEILVAAPPFLRYAHDLFAAGPVRRLHLIDVGAHLGPVLRCPFLSRLSALTVFGAHLGEPLGLGVARCPHLSGLRELRLGRNRLTDSAADALAGSPVLSNLEVLDLWGNELTETGARALAASPHLAGLRRLDLKGNPVGPAGAEAVAGSERLAALEWLGLEATGLGSQRVAAATRIGELVRVPALDLKANGLGAAAVKSIFGGPANDRVRVRELDLSHNELGEDGVRALAGCAALAGLRTLKLFKCGVTDAALGALAASPHLNALTALDLSNNTIGDAGLGPFAAASQLKSLRRLVIPGIGVSPGVRRALNQRFHGGMERF